MASMRIANQLKLSTNGGSWRATVSMDSGQPMVEPTSSTHASTTRSCRRRWFTGAVCDVGVAE